MKMNTHSCAMGRAMSACELNQSVPRRYLAAVASMQLCSLASASNTPHLRISTTNDRCIKSTSRVVLRVVELASVGCKIITAPPCTTSRIGRVNTLSRRMEKSSRIVVSVTRLRGTSLCVLGDVETDVCWDDITMKKRVW